MLFMSIFSWDASNRDEVIKRRAEGSKLPEGVELVGEWAVIGQNQVFRLVKATDEGQLVNGTLPWTDLGEIEIYPVMSTDELFKMMGMA